jgi:transcription elongation factor GreA
MTFLSKEKLEELTSELEKMKNMGRKEIAGRLDEAKAYGDLSENAEYHQAREDQGKAESRIQELEYIIKNAEIIEKHHSDIVELGATVTICKKNCSTSQVFEITGKEDSDIMNGKIDMDAPLASAMMGKKEEDTFDFKKPNGEVVSYRIVSIK